MSATAAWIALLASSLGQPAVDARPLEPTVAQAPSDQQLLLFAAQFDGVTLTETLTAYGDPADPLLPIGELSRLLELDIAVRLDQQMVNGRVGAGQRSLTLDLIARRALLAGEPITFDAADLKVTDSEVYLRASVLQKLLPVRFRSSPDDLLLDITATQTLPVQARKDRQSRLAGLADTPGEGDQVLRVADPYRWFGRPAADVSLELAADSTRRRPVTRFEGRLAGDLMQATVTAYLASDENGKLNAARLRAERRSSEGNLLGPLHATYVAAGDVYTPGLAVGPRSIGGAGVMLSTTATEEASVFERINMRGDLPIGYDVELYVNDILRSGRQGRESNGRYEFLDVPLVRGRNVVRIVFYGPRGERTEDTRIVNVGGGQLAVGKVEINAGVVAQDDPVLCLSKADIQAGARARGALRAVLSANYGLTSGVTAGGGLAIYTDYVGAQHKVITADVRTSLLGLAVQGDMGLDASGGSAISVGAAGRVGGFNFLARHVEYTGAFVDEANVAWELGRGLDHYSELTFDAGLKLPGIVRLPLSGRIDWSTFADGGSTVAVRGRTTLGVAGTIFSLSTDYLRKTDANGAKSSRTGGTLAASRLIDYKWQLRAFADYQAAPRTKLRALGVTMDRALSERTSLRLGCNQTFEGRDLSLQAGFAAHLPFAVATVNGDWSAQSKRWRVGLQLSFGLGFDPVSSHYRVTPPGPANGGSAAVLAFVDNNANGEPDPGEAPVAGVQIAGAGRPIETDAQGHAYMTGLGDGATAMLRFDSSNAKTDVVAAAPELIGLAPRSGSATRVLYAMVPASEVVVRLNFRQGSGANVGLSAVRIQLVPDHGAAIEGSTEFDGTAVFDDVKPGRYALRLDAEQAARLGMILESAVSVVVGGDGHTKRVEGQIAFQRSNGA